jgi:hypothetical protein
MFFHDIKMCKIKIFLFYPTNSCYFGRVWTQPKHAASQLWPRRTCGEEFDRQKFSLPCLLFFYSTQLISCTVIVLAVASKPPLKIIKEKQKKTAHTCTTAYQQSTAVTPACSYTHTLSRSPRCLRAITLHPLITINALATIRSPLPGLQ